MGSERGIGEEAPHPLPAQEGREGNQSVQVCGQEELTDEQIEIIQSAAITLVVESMLEGNLSPKGVAEATGLDLGVAKNIMGSHELAKAYTEAQRNMVQSAIDRLERNVHRNIKVIEKNLTNKDPRVCQEAARDLLNRTPGLAPGAKVEVGVAAYQKMVERYIEPEEK